MLGVGIAAPAILRPDPPAWLRERGVLTAELAVYHPSREHTTFRRAEVRVDERGIWMPLRRPVLRQRAKLIAETLIEQFEAGMEFPFLLPCYDGELYEYLVAPTTEFLESTSTSNQTYNRAVDYNPTNNRIDCIGAGGSSETGQGSAGGGGAFARKVNLAIGATATYRVQASDVAPGGDRRHTWFNGTSLANASVGAEGGVHTRTNTGPKGGKGRASESVGDVKRDGGDGGNPQGTTTGGSGGGAGGPDSPGEDGGHVGGSPGAGGGPNGGAGGSTGVTGPTGTYYDPTHGTGGGGRGRNTGHGGFGGNFGGGGGAGPFGSGGMLGGQGLIVVYWVPTGGNMMLMF